MPHNIGLALDKLRLAADEVCRSRVLSGTPLALDHCSSWLAELAATGFTAVATV